MKEKKMAAINLYNSVKSIINSIADLLGVIEIYEIKIFSNILVIRARARIGDVEYHLTDSNLYRMFETRRIDLKEFNQLFKGTIEE